MINIIFIFISALIGAFFRHYIYISIKKKLLFWDIFSINLVSCFCMGILSVIIYSLNIKVVPQLKISITLGLLLGFIIVSTLHLGAYVIFDNYSYIQTILATIITIFCDFIAIGSGIITAFIIIKLT
ncbi:MAG: CrcB family protein [Brevinema sp.]